MNYLNLGCWKLATQNAKANKKYIPAIDLMYAYAHAILDDEAIKLTGFSSADKLFAFIRGFHGLIDLRNFSHNKCPCLSKT